MNLKELAKARRLRVTAVIPPQYNPIRPRLRPPLVEPRQFHSSASTLSPPSTAIATSTRCSFQRSFPLEPLSFLRLFVGAPRPITSGALHLEGVTLLLSFLFQRPCFLLILPPPPCPAVALSYSVFYFFPRRPPSYRPLTGLIFSPFFLFSAISYSAPWE